MAPRANKSSYLKRCSITVVGSLGKDAKATDIEKWTVNNGGAFNSKINGGTTHVICTWDTYKHNNFALPKTYADKKKLQFVKWDWLEDTLRERRVKPTKKYLHPRAWESKVDKKVARRQALLTGKSIKYVESVQDIEIDKAETVDNSANEDTKSRSTPPFRKDPQPVVEEERVPLVFDVFTDENEVTWKVVLKGSELADPEDGDYILSVIVSNGKEQYYKAQYEYIEPDDEPLSRLLGVGSSLDSVRVEFETFYKNKAGCKWSEHYAKLKDAVQNSETGAKDHETDSVVEGENDTDMQT